jgi:hypothetical protein
MDTNNIPKQFCDNAFAHYTAESFSIGFSSGGNANVYAFTPAHAKRLSLMLAHNIAEFEKQHGAVTTEWPLKQESPIQMKDLEHENGND